MRVLLVSPQSKVWSSPKLLPLGLAYIAATLERAGHAVRIWDAVVESTPLESVLAEGFDFVGVTATTPLIKEAWQAAETAHAAGARVVLGGAHPTLLPEESLAKPYVDFVIRGEGEDALVELLANLEAPWSVQGLCYKDETGAVVCNPERPLRRDLDALPFPAHHLFPVERYSNLQPLTDGIIPNARAFTILTSRGCPYGCIYCSKSISGRTWRPRSPESVVEEWHWLVHEQRATEIGVTDDVLNLQLDRVKRICRLLIDEGLNKVPWVTIHGIRADKTDAELFQLMKKAGCKRVGFGVESGDQRILDIMKKQQTVDQVREAFRLAKRAGLQTMGFFMFGLPGENEQSMDATIRLAVELNPDLANFMITSPFPGTELYEMILRDGQLFSHDWADFAIHDEKAHFAMGEVTAELVERKWHEAYRRFYLRPSRILRQAGKRDTWRNLPVYLATAKRFLLDLQGSTRRQGNTEKPPCP